MSKKITRFTFNSPCSEIPRWAILEREYLELANRAPDMLADYLTPEGEIIWPESVPDFQSNVDNAFEGFSSFPLMYLLGGGDHLLEYSHRQYDALTRQFSRYKRLSIGSDSEIVKKTGRDTMLVDEWYPENNWMHIAEGSMFLYYLALADPHNAKTRDRVLRFAEYLIGENPAGFESNYDPYYCVFKTSEFGSNGPAFERFGKPYYYATWMDTYGLAFYDVPGVTTLLDLKKPENAKLYGIIYGKRLKHADTITNLMSTSLAMKAYMYTGSNRYKDFVLNYVSAWRYRASGMDGLVPDNCGPHGIVGETMHGRFYGGTYGWTHPHGYYFIEDALIIGGENERLLNGNPKALDWARDLYKYLVDNYGITGKYGELLFPHKYAEHGSIIEYYAPEDTPMTRPDRVTKEPGMVRFKQINGFYEFGKGNPAHLGHIFTSTFSDSDAELALRIIPEYLHEVTPRAISKKYKGGQDTAFIAYQMGKYPDFPVDILEHSIDLYHKQQEILDGERAGKPAPYGYRPGTEEEWKQLELITKELHDKWGLKFHQSVAHSYHQTYLLYRTPLSAEAMVSLTMGSVMPIYNGGLFAAAFRHFDGQRKRPGLPEDVAVLVGKQSYDSETGLSRAELTLCNLSDKDIREIIVQGGAYAEHELRAFYLNGERHNIDGKWLSLTLHPRCLITIDVELKRYAYQPVLTDPFV
ncbi:MAG: hypothetical protein ACOX22_11325 [Caldicoprobacterales bacterium]